MAISSQSIWGTPSISRVSSKDPDSLNTRVLDPDGGHRIQIRPSGKKMQHRGLSTKKTQIWALTQ